MAPCPWRRVESRQCEFQRQLTEVFFHIQQDRAIAVLQGARAEGEDQAAAGPTPPIASPLLLTERREHLAMGYATRGDHGTIPESDPELF